MIHWHGDWFLGKAVEKCQGPHFVGLSTLKAPEDHIDNSITRWQ